MESHVKIVMTWPFIRVEGHVKIVMTWTVLAHGHVKFVMTWTVPGYMSCHIRPDVDVSWEEIHVKFDRLCYIHHVDRTSCQT